MSTWTDAISAREQFRDLHRITTDTGSHIEPPLDAAWDHITQLRWKAAVVEAETGIRIVVTPGRYTINGHEVPDTYSLNIGSISVGSTPFDDCWTLLTGVSLGAREARKDA